MINPSLPFHPSSAQVIDPAAFAWLYGSGTVPVYVAESTVGGLPAIGRGIDIVSNAVATMMVGADVLDAAGNEVPSPQVVTRPWLWYGSFEFWDYVTRSLMLRGNFVGIIAARDEMGNPTQVKPINAGSVSMDVSTGWPVYTVDGHAYGWDEVIHLRSGGQVGSLWGQGIVERYRTNLEGALYGQTYGVNSFKNGAVPSAVVTLDTDNVEESVAEQVSTDWLDKHGAGERKPAVVPRTMKIEPIGFSPHDAEFVESRKLSIAECALICGLSPSDLEAGLGGQSLTYANLEQRSQSAITNNYGRWVRIIEEGWSDLLPIGQKVRANPEALLRTSTAERYAAHEQSLSWRTPNEIRAIEGLDPIEGGDKLAEGRMLQAVQS